MQFHLFLPQMRMSLDAIVERARAAEAAGFGGIAGMDHLAPPLAEHTPMYSSMVTNTWIAAHTERLSISSLVLCDSFRLPSVLANEAVSIDHASGGRYELGIGWGSVPTEFTIYGVGSTEPRQRVDRLRESLEVMTRLWAGESVDFDGEYHQLKGARQAAVPLSRIPIVIGGTGPKTLALVRDYADWWNVHVGALDRVQELRSQVGDAKASIQQMVAYIPNEASRAEITELALKRFGRSRPIIGNGEELIEHYNKLAGQGIERVYTWFCDFAAPESLEGFGAEVISKMAKG